MARQSCSVAPMGIFPRAASNNTCRIPVKHKVEQAGFFIPRASVCAEALGYYFRFSWDA